MRRLKQWVKALFGVVGLAVVRQSTLDDLRGITEQEDPQLPIGAREALRADHPRLLELQRRYAGHPAATHTQWTPSFVRKNIDLTRFRSENAFHAQHAAEPDRKCRYALSTTYVREHDSLSLLECLDEDGLFGASVLEADGKLVSRDLLDSIIELTFLDDVLGLSQFDQPTILDIGAGYGRLAHRAVLALNSCTWLCTDAVPTSTFLSEYYLEFRGATQAGARVVPLDEIDVALRAEGVDLAVNIHSFSECPSAAIRWWLDLLDTHDVRRLFIVPNDVSGLPLGVYSTEAGGKHLDYQPLLEERGFEVVAQRPKYAASPMVQRLGIWPTQFFLFSR